MASILKVDKLDPQSGTDLEIGSSGDTITIPSGATFTQSGTMNASAITAGTVDTARLGSGTASSSTVLYGDQTYKAEPSGGVSQFSSWYITATYTPGGTDGIITGWSQSDASGYNRLGTAPTESSDVFSMPETGWWWVTLTLTTGESSLYGDGYGLSIQLTTDSGSNFYNVVQGCNRHVTGTSTDQYRVTTIQGLVKITNVSTDKIRFYHGGIAVAYTDIIGGSQNATTSTMPTSYGTFSKLTDV